MKKTALLKCCIKQVFSSQEAKCYLVGLCETQFIERHASIPALVTEPGGPETPTYFHGGTEGPNLSVYFYNNTSHECI